MSGVRSDERFGSDWRPYGVRRAPHPRPLWLAGMLALLALPACERRPAPTSAPATSPVAVIENLIAARRAGAYQQIRELTSPERAEQVLRTLLAVDAFLSTNQQLCDLVRTQVALGVADTIDHSRLAYHLDIFSRHVRVLDATAEGSYATVAYLVDGELPVRHAPLRLVNGAWRYDPGPGPYEALAQAFERMDHGLRQVLDALREGRLSAEQMRDDPQKLVEEVRIRLLPGIKLLPPATQPTRETP